MRYILCAILLLCLLAAPAAAQVPQPPPSIDDRVAAQIGALVLQGVRQAMQIELLQKQLTEAQEKIKKLESAPPAAKP